MGTLVVKKLKRTASCRIKGATKLYFTHYSCTVIILFNTGLYKSAFSIYSFGKLVFVAFCLLGIEFDVIFINFVTFVWLLFIIYYDYYCLSTLCFSSQQLETIYKNRYCVIKDWVHASRELLSLWVVKILFTMKIWNIHTLKE